MKGAPIPPNTHAVALHARDEAHLLAIASRLKAAGIDHVLIEECECGPQSTRGFSGTATAIGIKPIPLTERARIYRLVSDLPLAKDPAGGRM